MRRPKNATRGRDAHQWPILAVSGLWLHRGGRAGFVREGVKWKVMARSFPQNFVPTAAQVLFLACKLLIINKLAPLDGYISNRSLQTQVLTVSSPKLRGLGNPL